ncbi:hypothetical protein BDV39DRAFT_203053 [Aspergillus sergii]|uniref:Uncharacterized protein n=1 Tax=Aspergillus sergii TaxID=1034303 RepID=A0A5N6X9E7_9EURO|nr:hypothetical protein BDV39DRAFT_203053 [Aspergillus sergii]
MPASGDDVLEQVYTISSKGENLVDTLQDLEPYNFILRYPGIHEDFNQMVSQLKEYNEALDQSPGDISSEDQETIKQIYQNLYRNHAEFLRQLKLKKDYFTGCAPYSQAALYVLKDYKPIIENWTSSVTAYTPDTADSIGFLKDRLSYFAEEAVKAFS